MMVKKIDSVVDDETGVVSCSSRFRTAYNHGDVKIKKAFFNPSRTKQEFKDQCDVNKIVANYMRTGNVELLGRARESYFDMAGLPASYHEALTLVAEATQTFSLLPAVDREKYGNDVNIFLQAAYENPDEVFGVRTGSTEPSSPIPGVTPPGSSEATPASPQAPSAPLQSTAS